MKKITKILILSFIIFCIIGGICLIKVNKDLKEITKVNKYESDTIVSEVPEREPIKSLPSYSNVVDNIKIQMEIGLLSGSNPFDVKYITTEEVNDKVDERLVSLGISLDEKDKKAVIEEVMKNLDLLNDIGTVVDNHIKKEDEKESFVVEKSEISTEVSTEVSTESFVEVVQQKRDFKVPLDVDYTLIKRYTGSNVELNIYQTDGESIVYSHLDGTILSVSDEKDKYIIVAQNDGVITVFAGFAKIDAKVGQSIKNGDILGLTGNYQDAYQNCIIVFNPN